jgi:hypothetical protein
VGDGRRRRIGEPTGECLAGIEGEGGDVDKADHVRRLRPEGGHDLAAVRVAHDDRRTILAAEHLAQARDVIGERSQGELGGGDRVVGGLQALHHVAPARALGPRAVDEDDIRLAVGCHGVSFLSRR